MSGTLNERVAAFVRDVCAAMGVSLDATVEETADNVWIQLAGDDGDLLLEHKAEALDALQHVVNAAFRRELQGSHHFVVDCRGYRKNRDAELRQMAQFLVGKAKSSGIPQELGPLNPYARRIVHLAVSADPDVASESIGDAFLKTVIISKRQS